MMAPWRRKAGEERSPRRTALLATGLVAFLVLDVVLIVAAVHATSGSEPGRLGPIPTFTSTPDPSASPARRASPKPSSAPSATATAQTSISGASRLLSAASATIALRATSGSCPGASPVIERTTNGGSTWTRVRLGSRAVDEVVALDAGTQKNTLTGVSGGSCAPSSVVSFTSGEFWADSPSDLASAAYLVPGSDAVHLTSGTTTAPCQKPASVLETNGTAAVACQNELAVKAGQSPWQLVNAPNLVAATRVNSAYLLGVTGKSGCSGIAIESVSAPVTADSTLTTVGCAAATGTLDASTVVLSASGKNVWLWAGSTVTVSNDGGATW